MWGWEQGYRVREVKFSSDVLSFRALWDINIAVSCRQERSLGCRLMSLIYMSEMAQ